MLKHLAQSAERLHKFVELLPAYPCTDEVAVQIGVFSAPGCISFREALKGPYRPTQEGEHFGPRWSTHWFKITGRIPSAWRGKEVHLRFQSTSEAMVWSADGRPVQGLVSANWAGEGHSAGPEDIRSNARLTKSARGGESVTLYVESSITGLMGFGMRGTNPRITDPGFVGKLALCRLAVFDREAWDLQRDLRMVELLANQLPETHQLRIRALAAGNALINTLDLSDRTTWPDARKIAASFFAENQGPRRFQVSATGHAHIDTAWLWTCAETIRKSARSFVSQLRLMEDYPEHKFACSQAQQLAWIETRYPSLFAEIQSAARSGSFLPCGGTWVEPDCNLPSGESLVRQFLLGQRFYLRVFGRRCREFWNPDVFGYSAAMPQIMKGAGIDYFLTQKLSWNQFNKPVSSTFLWEGIDGTRILTHFPPSDTYNGTAEPAELFATMEKHRDTERTREAYYLFGHGDGGGGPTAAMLENLRRQRGLDGMPAVEIRGPEEFFTRLARDCRDPLVWSGELYFELHRGTYTTQAANKRNNRRSEEALHDAEFLAALAHAVAGQSYPHAILTRAWELLCLNQFHDIIPGSSIQEVYRDSARDYEEILSSVRALCDAACDTLWPAEVQDRAATVLVLNTLSFPRNEVVETKVGPLLLGAPSLGHATHSLTDPKRKPDHLSPVRVRRTAEFLTFENGLVRAKFDADGRIVSFLDLRHDRECIASGRHGNQFVLHEDKPLFWDAWDVDIFHLEKSKLVGKLTGLKIVCADPLVAKVELDFTLTANSTLRQTVILKAGSPVLEFACNCEWRETQKFLKVEFPLALRSDHATYEIQFGHVRRPTHFNTSWDWARFEVCAQRWADLSEPDFGVALLNDSKYGYACHGNVLRLSLLRAPTWPDPTADRGLHAFRYGLFPHTGGPQTGDVVSAAAAFNQPLHLRYSSLPPGEVRSFFQTDNPAIVIDTIKKSEDGDDLVVRLYESRGTHAKGRLLTTLPLKHCTPLNLLEDPVGSPIDFKKGMVPVDLRPFEIISRRLRLTQG